MYLFYHAIENTIMHSQPEERKASNLLILQAYVALIVLATVFSMVCYKLVMQHSLVVYHEISHLYFLGIHTCLKA